MVAGVFSQYVIPACKSGSSAAACGGSKALEPKMAQLTNEESAGRAVSLIDSIVTMLGVIGD